MLINCFLRDISYLIPGILLAAWLSVYNVCKHLYYVQKSNCKIWETLCKSCDYCVGVEVVVVRWLLRLVKSCYKMKVVSQ